LPARTSCSLYSLKFSLAGEMLLMWLARAPLLHQSMKTSICRPPPPSTALGHFQLLSRPPPPALEPKISPFTVRRQPHVLLIELAGLSCNFQTQARKSRAKNNHRDSITKHSRHAALQLMPHWKVLGRAKLVGCGQ